MKSTLNKIRYLLTLVTIVTIVQLGDTRTMKGHHYGYHDYLSNRQSIAVKCNGEENLKTDIGIISFVFGGISSVAGLFSLTEFSWPSNNISIISTVLSLVFWIPSAVLTFLAWSDPVSWLTGNIVNLISLVVTLYGGVGIITGTADIIVSTIDEFLGIFGLILSSLTTFPDMFDELKELFQEMLGREEVDTWIRGYGCGGNTAGSGFGRFMRNLIFG